MESKKKKPARKSARTKMLTKGRNMSAFELPPVRPDLGMLLDLALRTGGETSDFDFKEVLDVRIDEHKLRLVRAVGAFGNTDTGGHIWIGVTDQRNVVGVSEEIVALYDQTRIQQIMNQHLAPPPAIQVRHHVNRGGQRLIAIEVSPFRDVPSTVRITTNAGSEKLQAGTLLFRNSAAQSAVLTSELDMRKLCEAIVNRRATAITELLQKGLVGLQGTVLRADRFEPLRVLRERAEAYWPSGPGEPPYVEVFFTAERDLRLSGEDLKALIPRACVPGRHGFPFYDVYGGPVETAMPWGWLGAIPFSDKPDPKLRPGYLWLLGRNGAFLYREGFWEDHEHSVLPGGGVGIYHVAGELIRLVRFLDRMTAVLKTDEATRFSLGMALNNVRGRYLDHEMNPFHLPATRKQTTEPRIEVSVETSLMALRSAREEVVVNLLAEVAWQFRRNEWTRQQLLDVLRTAEKYLGADYAFPKTEMLPQVAA